jgi:hypothetical protein
MNLTPEIAVTTLSLVVSIWAASTASKSAKVALESAELASKSYDNSKINQRADIFLNLRSRHNSIHGLLPEYIFNSQTIPQENTEDWRNIEKYWLLSFDEWFIATNVITYDERFLWLQFYRPVQKSSLNHDGMRTVLKVMFDGKISFGGQRKEYLTEIQIMAKEIGKFDMQQIN